MAGDSNDCAWRMFAKVREAERPGLGPARHTTSRFVVNVGKRVEMSGRKKKVLEQSIKARRKPRKLPEAKKTLQLPKSILLIVPGTSLFFLR